MTHATWALRNYVFFVRAARVAPRRNRWWSDCAFHWLSERLRFEEEAMAANVDRTGQVFNGLTFLHRAPSKDGHNGYWKILCVCGVKWDVFGSDVVIGKTRSCGCLTAELQQATKSGVGTPSPSTVRRRRKVAA